MWNGQLAGWLAVAAIAGMLSPALLCSQEPAAKPAGAPAATQVYYMTVFNNPAQGKEAEYNRWYQEEHAPNIVAGAGFVNGQRYVEAGAGVGPSQSAPRTYMVMYRIDTSDLNATYQNMKATAPKPTIMPVDSSSNFSVSFKHLGGEIKGHGSRQTGKGEMKTYLYCVFDTPLTGHEAEFNQWYEKQEAPAIAATPGVVSAQRYLRSDVQIETAKPSAPDLIMYKIVTDDLNAVLTAIGERAKAVAPDAAHDAAKSQSFTRRRRRRPWSQARSSASIPLPAASFPPQQSWKSWVMGSA